MPGAYAARHTTARIKGTARSADRNVEIRWRTLFKRSFLRLDVVCIRIAITRPLTPDQINRALLYFLENITNVNANETQANHQAAPHHQQHEHQRAPTRGKMRNISTHPEAEDVNGFEHCPDQEKSTNRDGNIQWDERKRKYGRQCQLEHAPQRVLGSARNPFRLLVRQDHRPVTYPRNHTAHKAVVLVHRAQRLDYRAGHGSEIGTARLDAGIANPVNQAVKQVRGAGLKGTGMFLVNPLGKHNIVTVLRQSQHFGNQGRRMLAVSIHGDGIITLREVDSSSKSRLLSKIATEFHHRHPLILPGKF